MFRDDYWCGTQYRTRSVSLYEDFRESSLKSTRGLSATAPPKSEHVLGATKSVLYNDTLREFVSQNKTLFGSSRRNASSSNRLIPSYTIRVKPEPNPAVWRRVPSSFTKQKQVKKQNQILPSITRKSVPREPARTTNYWGLISR